MEIQQLTTEFLPSRWIKGPFSEIPGEGWFLLEINPLPPEDEIEKVVTDIENDKPVRVGYETGKIYHSSNCHHSVNPPITEEMKNAIQHLKDDTFLVAILPKGPVGLKNQPVVIALEPEINYYIYPDHPHLNEDGYYGNVNNLYYPHSFCYKHDHSKFKGDRYSRVLDAFEQVSIWLFRHQVWLATRETQSKGRWIGKGQPPLPDGCFPRILNPEMHCRCGSKNKYKDCHLKADFYKRVDTSFDNKYFNAKHLKDNWVFIQEKWYEESLQRNKESLKKIKHALM